MSHPQPEEILRPTLRWQRADREPTDYTVWPERPIMIGRELTCTIAIDSPFVSKRHAVFSYGADSYVVEDLGSVSGTRINGSPVGHADVNIGDVIEIGDERFVFIDRSHAELETRPAFSKRTRLGVAAGMTLCAGVLLCLLLLPRTNTFSSRNQNQSTVTAGVQLDRLDKSDSMQEFVRQTVAQMGGDASAGALADQGLLQFRAGRLRDAVALFAAAVKRDPKDALIVGRLQSVEVALERAIEQHSRQGERAFSQLRLDDAVRQWEQVLLLTDERDSRHQQAKLKIETVSTRRARR